MILTPKERKKITSWIEWQELCRCGLKQINGADTKVTCLKICNSDNPKQKILKYNLYLIQQDMGDGISNKHKYKSEMFICDTTIKSILTN